MKIKIQNVSFIKMRLNRIICEMAAILSRGRWVNIATCDPLQWCHNECNGISNHQRPYYLLNHLFRHSSKKTSKLRVTGHSERNPLVTGGFSSQKASYVKNVSIWPYHHARTLLFIIITLYLSQYFIINIAFYYILQLYICIYLTALISLL